MGHYNDDSELVLDFITWATGDGKQRVNDSTLQLKPSLP